MLELFLLLLYLIYSIVSDALVNPLLKYYTNNFFIGFRLFTIIEHVLIVLFLHHIIISLKFKKIIKVLSGLFLLYAIFDFINSKSNTFDSTPSGITSILILSYCIYYFFEKIKTPDSLFLYSTPNFWIVVALIIFFSGTFFIYIYSQNNYNDPAFKSIYNLINSTFIILRNLLFSIAFLIKTDKGKQSIQMKF